MHDRAWKGVFDFAPGEQCNIYASWIGLCLLVPPFDLVSPALIQRPDGVVESIAAACASADFHIFHLRKRSRRILIFRFCMDLLQVKSYKKR